ncbi:hypothetical protein [Streptomyces showdoensis]|uniref:hypothetical protein n=1 Tax=Streptomyces showdoensis TaxID=68268 RepID=UPI000F4DDF1D|nr:hypothetical protein [Streptomyces showdoensis]
MPRRVQLAPAAAAPADATGRVHLLAVTVDGRIRTRVQARPGGGRQPWAAFGDRAVATPRSSSPAP